MPHQKTVCIVDDDDVHLASMALMLTRMDFDRIVTFSNGEEALEFLNSEPCDLVVSDWNMDPMDGLELLGRIRRHARTRELPFVMVTANASEDFRSRALSAGASDFLIKPLSLILLRNVVKRLICPALHVARTSEIDQDSMRRLPVVS